jgi:hypothetical protein
MADVRNDVADMAKPCSLDKRIIAYNVHLAVTSASPCVLREAALWHHLVVIVGEGSFGLLGCKTVLEMIFFRSELVCFSVTPPSTPPLSCDVF